VLYVGEYLMPIYFNYVTLDSTVAPFIYLNPVFAGDCPVQDITIHNRYNRLVLLLYGQILTDAG
jgi:ABC-type polysaccharide/polyol phosphate export permease